MEVSAHLKMTRGDLDRENKIKELKLGNLTL